jgi:hypothetical protein
MAKSFHARHQDSADPGRCSSWPYEAEVGGGAF